MNTPFHRMLAISALALAWPATALAAAKPSFDIAPPLKRQATVKLAQGFANPPVPAAVPADLPSPFNPPDFDPKPKQPGGTEPHKPEPGDKNPEKPKPEMPRTDRALLEAVAAKIPATSAVMLGRPPRPILFVAGGKRIEIGSTLTVNYDNQDYDLEVVAIDRTTFTLRYRGEEITRPIRLK